MTTLLTPPMDLVKKESKHFSSSAPVDMSRVACIILGGGEGTRLHPLTVTRCKPAICFGGRYRLIDIPMSNSINSGCLKIFIITQFLSSSLHQHIFKTYRMGTFSSGFIELLPAEQGPKNKGWFQGPADAVRKNLKYFIETPVDYFLILSGDQLYNIDFQRMIQMGRDSNADLVVAALPVNETDAKRMGILKINRNCEITDFCEKPQTSELLDEMSSPEVIEDYGFSSVSQEKRHLGSMGIYLFKREALLDLLQKDQREDFGKHLIPTKVKEGKTFAFLYDGYWEDIGTIESFFNANISLTKQNPEFDCYDEKNPIFACHQNLAGPKIFNTKITSSIICEGSVIEADKISHSILGPRSVIKKGATISHSYLMGNDFYHPPIRTDHLPEQLYIGEDCVINNAIIDKHVHLGKGVQLINKDKLNHYVSENVFIRDGIIVVTRGASLPDGFIL